MRVLVCGGREFGKPNYDTDPIHPGMYRVRHDHKKAEYDFALRELDRIFTEMGLITDEHWLPEVHIIAGEATGADTIAKDYAVINWTGYSGFPADWQQYGKKAGFIRNKQMLEEGKPDLVVAFPGGKGTAMMVDIAKKAGVPVKEISYSKESLEEES